MSFQGLSGEEIEQFRRIFALSDINHDGVLNKREAVRGLKSLGYKPAAVMAALKRADANGDGVINFEEFVRAIALLKKSHGFSPNEVAVFRRVYDSCDKDFNGTLNANELVAALQDLGYNPSSAARILESADKNKDGVIDFDEFLGALWSVKAVGHGFPPDQVAIWRNIFNKWDVNKDGRLDKHEIGTALLSMGFSSGAVDGILKQADKNGDGIIDFEEFLTALWQHHNHLHSSLPHGRPHPHAHSRSHSRSRSRSRSHAHSHSLSPQDIAFYRKVFDSCDTNRNGSLDRKEAASAFIRLGFPRSSLRSLFNKADKNGDGVIRFDEFLTAISNHQSFHGHHQALGTKRAGRHGLGHHGHPGLFIVVKLFPRHGFLSSL